MSPFVWLASAVSHKGTIVQELPIVCNKYQVCHCSLYHKVLLTSQDKPWWYLRVGMLGQGINLILEKKPAPQTSLVNNIRNDGLTAFIIYLNCEFY